MHIAIDISQVVYDGTGVARFTRRLVEALAHHPRTKKHRFTLFFSSLNRRLPDDIRVLCARHKHLRLLRWFVPPRALAYLWNTPTVRLLAPTPEVFDVWISSDWTEAPPRIAAHKATVLHDLVIKRYPETVDPVILSTHEARMKLVADESEWIFCDSESTARDLHEFYPHCRGASVVNYLGVTPLAAPNPSETFPFSFSPGKYFLSVGKMEPRKNLNRLVEAFAQFKQRPHTDEYSLVIVGPKGWDVESSTLDHKDVHLLGNVPDEHLSQLYTHATAFAYVSLYEGFGIPPLEAMHAGTPVILSNTSSLAEIGTAESALYVDPLSVEAISSAMHTVIQDQALRERMISQGKLNAQKYTWSCYLDILFDTLEGVKDHPPKL